MKGWRSSRLRRVLYAMVFAACNAFTVHHLESSMKQSVVNIGRRLQVHGRQRLLNAGWRKTTAQLRETSRDEKDVGLPVPASINNAFTSPSRQSVETLLGSALGRAMRTLSTNTLDDDEQQIPSSGGDKSSSLQQDVVDLVAAASQRATLTLQDASIHRRTDKDQEYLKNPVITSTALAHELWSHVLRRNDDDIAIDATCGNGHDSVAIASMLFGSSSTDSEARLVCMDIQEQACENTRRALSEILDKQVLESNVSVLEASHESLLPYAPVGKVGLVCYNLGYLPSCDKNVITQTHSTVSSMADAALLVRVGGMISVMTYPRTNPNENFAVHALMEGLALLSSQDASWRDPMQEMGPNHDHEPSESDCSARDAVIAAMEYIEKDGDPQQTWRVMEHKKVGWPMAPILLTATRIK